VRASSIGGTVKSIALAALRLIARSNFVGCSIGFDRTFEMGQLAKLLNRLDNGDVLVVTRLDRLARSTRDLLNILDTVGKAGAGFKVLGDDQGPSPPT
jgi:DNA invertase Pin-like site-specific DNA recombinase